MHVSPFFIFFDGNTFDPCKKNFINLKNHQKYSSPKKYYFEDCLPPQFTAQSRLLSKPTYCCSVCCQPLKLVLLNCSRGRLFQLWRFQNASHISLPKMNSCWSKWKIRIWLFSVDRNILAKPIRMSVFMQRKKISL